MRLITAAGQTLGQRRSQNDAYVYDSTKVIVADGVGADEGARDVAATVVASYSRLSWSGESDEVRKALGAAPRVAAETLADAHLTGATTIAAAGLTGSGKLWVTSVGDSQVAIFRKGTRLYESPLHNERGDIGNLAGSRHVLTRYVSSKADFVPEIYGSDAMAGDVVLITTDGVHEVLNRAQIESILVDLPQPGESGLADAVGRILRDVAEAGQDDNATCCLAMVVDDSANDSNAP